MMIHAAVRILHAATDLHVQGTLSESPNKNQGDGNEWGWDGVGDLIWVECNRAA